MTEVSDVVNCAHQPQVVGCSEVERSGVEGAKWGCAGFEPSTGVDAHLLTKGPSGTSEDASRQEWSDASTGINSGVHSPEPTAPSSAAESSESGETFCCISAHDLSVPSCLSSRPVFCALRLPSDCNLAGAFACRPRFIAAPADAVCALPALYSLHRLNDILCIRRGAAAAPRGLECSQGERMRSRGAAKPQTGARKDVAKRKEARHGWRGGRLWWWRRAAAAAAAAARERRRRGWRLK